MANKTPTLDARISAALDANGSADRDILVSLIDEAFDELGSLEEIIKIETPRVMDLSNPDPEKSTAAITSANLKIARLNKALPLLQSRIAAIDEEKARTEWTAEADECRAINDDLYEELKALYPPFFDQLARLYIRILENDIACDKLKRRAPAGVDKSFVPVAPHSLFWANMQMPAWDRNVTIPLRKSPADIAWEIQVANVNAAVAQAKAIEAKHAQLYSSDGAAVHDEIHRRKAEEDEKAEQELKEKDQAARDQYYKDLAEAERRRIHGE